MRKILVGFLLVAVSSTSFAAEKIDKDKFCQDVLETSELIMRARLAGMPVTETVKIFSNAPTNKAMYNAMIRDAYTSPSYQTDDYKKAAITDFGAKYYLDCIQRAK